jgi:hypothetical protein
MPVLPCNPASLILSLLSLSPIPAPKLTDQGLVNAVRMQPTTLFACFYLPILEDTSAGDRPAITSERAHGPRLIR